MIFKFLNIIFVILHKKNYIVQSPQYLKKQDILNKKQKFMFIHISVICFCVLKDSLGQYFEMLPNDKPYSSLITNPSYNYGYWFKFQPLTKLKQRRFGNSTNYFYATQNEYLLSFELSSENTLSLWHIQTDKFDHIVNILQTDGMKSYVFTPDLQEYEGRWNFFGIQVINENQYQIIFFINKLEIKIIDAQIQRKQQQHYYFGGYGNFLNPDGFQFYFKYFKGKLTNFIELDQIVTESNFDDAVLSVRQDYLDKLKPMNKLYFDMLSFDGQTVGKYSHLLYREGIKYAFSMWVKSRIQQQLQPLNYSVFRASLSDQLTDTYLGDNELFISYQIGLLPKDNAVFAMTYSFETPIYQQQKKIDNDWIKIDYINLKYWHFIQFEYGRTSKPDHSPPIYNSLLTVILPYQSRQDNINWNRDNHHFSGVPIYFYLGGSLSLHENKFIGSISQFKFISQYTMDLQSIDLQSSIQCHYTCFTCTGPTSSDCSTCFAEKNRVYSANQCVCQIGYMNKDPALLDTLCELPSQKYKMIQFKETEYKCPEGYDQCEDKIVCSFGYFKVEQNCYLCPQQHSEQLQDIIFCSDCVLNPKRWGFNLQCRDNILKIDSSIFSVASTDTYEYRYNTNNNSLEIDTITYTISLGCEKGYALDNEFKCIKCKNCIRCQYDRDTQKCLECPYYYYLQQGNCIKCGINCVQCDSNGCQQCQEGSFLTLDKFNCNECSIQNCDYCYQYYQNSISNEIAISLDLKFNQVDLSLNGIVISCARCGYGFTISGNTCIEQLLSSECLTGIIENNKFQCLIGFDENTGLQFNNCNLIENCNSCFVKYPINPWCIQCVEGYYVLFEDGTCASCPDICLSCLRQNSAYQDQWKINIRAFYYYKFGSHLFEDFAIDTENYQYNVACTWCKDDYILFENICIPGCGQNCEVCEVLGGKALCTKCKDNQYGPVFSLDKNLQCLECPQKCQACILEGYLRYINIKLLFQLIDQQQ
ncbi:hypothetical protein pb186bvf_018027 [Paramecium bursaria]